MLTPRADNARFLYGPKKNLSVITVSPPAKITLSQAVVVEINADEATFKTYLTGPPRHRLEDALEFLYLETASLVYTKMSEGMGAPARIEPGQVVYQGVLQWKQ